MTPQRKIIKTLPNFSENSHENFPFPPFASPWQALSMVRISCLAYTLWRILEPKANLTEGQQLQQKDRKRRKRKSQTEKQ